MKEQSLVPHKHGCLFVMETTIFLKSYMAPCELEPEEGRMLVCLNKSSKEASDLASLPGLLLCRPLELPPIFIPVSDPLKTSHCSPEDPKCFTEHAKPVTVSPQPTLPAFLPLTLSSVPLQHLTFPQTSQCRFLSAGNAILPSLCPGPLHLTFQDPGRSLLWESSPSAQVLLG